jgi:hypothetical protein
MPPLGIDSRIAATGGKSDGGGHYIWPGMMDHRSWARTKAHQHTKQYSCAHCGQAFNQPDAIYTHMAKIHGI